MKPKKKDVPNGTTYYQNDMNDEAKKKMYRRGLEPTT